MQRIFATALALLCSLPAAAAGPFDPVPPEKSGKANELLLRVVQYQGSTNGSITVDVRNPSEVPRPFSASGLYFVPQTHPDQAPQRLGAVGPFRVLAGKGQDRQERVTIPAGATWRLTLDVYCIDSHRSSPSSKTPFRVAKDRVPPPLMRAIDADARKSAAALGGLAAPAAKSAVQSEVWKNRDAKWIELDGEGKQERSKRR